MIDFPYRTMTAGMEPAPSLTVKNVSSSSKKIITGCRSNGEVLFNDINEIPPGETEEFANLPDTSFEIGVKVEHGPQSTETYRPESGLTEITATVTDSHIDFESGSTDSVSAFEDSSDNYMETDSPSQVQSDDRAPDSEEVYCRNCGEIISQHAEICPACGVRNAAYEPDPDPKPAEPETNASVDAPQSTTSTETESSGSAPTNVGRFGILLSGGIWGLVGMFFLLALLLTLGMGTPIGSRAGFMIESLVIGRILAPLRTLAWAILPVSLYLDLRYINHQVDNWPLHGRLYIAAAGLLPVSWLAIEILSVSVIGRVIGVIVPLVIIWLCARHLRTRKRKLS